MTKRNQGSTKVEISASIQFVVQFTIIQDIYDVSRMSPSKNQKVSETFGVTYVLSFDEKENPYSNQIFFQSLWSFNTNVT